jgi:hypothetical protein
VTTYIVDVHHCMHICPADPVPHPIDTQRTIVAVTPGGPCQTPATYRFNDTTYTVPCKDRRRSDRQCPACRTTIWTRTVTTCDLGVVERDPNRIPAPSSSDTIPCPVCDTPVVRFLGVHLLCGTRITNTSTTSKVRSGDSLVLTAGHA